MDKSLPDGFPPTEQAYALYEGIRYQGYWEDSRLMRLDALERHLVQGLLPASGRRILDLGCGYGRLAPCYLDRFDSAVLCDGSLSLLRDARSALGDRAVYVAADVGLLPFKASSFDCLLSIRVLQHVHDLLGVLTAMHRVSSRGASLVFSYHNKRNAKKIPLALLDWSDSNAFSSRSCEPIPTLISRHPEVVEACLREAGFSRPECVGAAIVHPIAAITERLHSKRLSGARWASLMGRWRLAKWIICKSTSEGGDSMNSTPTQDMFLCPSCQSDVAASPGAFRCVTCDRTYREVDGIFDFRLGST